MALLTVDRSFLYQKGAFKPGRAPAGRTRLPLQCNAYSNTSSEGLSRIAKATSIVGAIAAATAFITPFCADAVSGGGGLGGSLAYKDLSGRDLHGEKLYKADLRGTDFSKANLKGASLFGAFAKGASFAAADLSNADLESVDFDGADLTNAILEGAQVTNAQFKNSKLEGSDWTDVILRRDVQKKLCAAASGTNPKTGVDTKESLLC